MQLDDVHVQRLARCTLWNNAGQIAPATHLDQAFNRLHLHLHQRHYPGLAQIRIDKLTRGKGPRKHSERHPDQRLERERASASQTVGAVHH